MIKLVGVIQAADRDDTLSKIRRECGLRGIGKERAPVGNLVIVDRHAKDMFRQRLRPAEINQRGVGLRHRKSLPG